MSSIECGGCDGLTNTALCDWVDSIDTGKAEKCYAKWENGRWVKGCATDKGFMRDFADKTIRNQTHENNQIKDQQHTEPQSN